ncbi:D-aminopeptidase DppA. Metallo peptidase. MEROPS family M55 [Halobacillus karajensis]|uniref:D-aminopeptidase n=1 Tax=Halobacillus karajensis TaxID=195088 RepID=A0A024P2B9_9BACI|nr:M55 family metallopeptidase [Halobacillus karajensis]CDQ19959.1 D-aminopeptidase [Halobacillus karajensis]CDQ22419.1 D-aminopeptidase [Halobacillus karajensis]CDQ28262.1 D-aminopeptidase [Halobacillus karajensis]SEH69192.1 D-aminopeptidase DppA. Metallo peptidase. MEROPS family M55 [Halobacillus karajensis]
MKLYLSVDMEGITGVPDYTFVDSSKHNYERARRIMTEETNYVIRSAMENKADEVLVNDSHSKMNNLLIDEIHPDATLITGSVKPLSMVQGLDDSFSGALFVGYHARAAQKGVLSHSMTFGVRNFYINDTPVGELGFNAYVAGYYGVPVLMVAGDDCAAQEAEALIPNVVTAPVKETISRSAVKSLTPKKAGELLEERTAQALQNRTRVEPLVPPDYPTLRIEFMNYGQAEWANLMPGTDLEPNSTTVRFRAKDILEAYQAMLVMTELAMQTTSS